MLRRNNSNVLASLDQKQIAELKEAFSFIDQNSDGFVDKADLQQLLISLGRSSNTAQVEADAMFANVQNELNFTAFLSMMADKIQESEQNEGELLKACEALDETYTGKLGIDTLRSHLVPQLLIEAEFETIAKTLPTTVDCHELAQILANQ